MFPSQKLYPVVARSDAILVAQSELDKELMQRIA
jgi:hypothetical protein